MSGSQIVGLGIRLFAIWLVLYVLTNAPGMWRFNVSEGAGSANLVVILVSVLLLVVAAALWFFPLSVANNLVPRTAKRTDDVERPGVPFERIESLAFCLLGLWILAEAVPNCFYWVLMAYHASRPESLLHFGPVEYARVAVTGTKLVMALWLLLGAKGLRGLLRWARTAGT